MWYDSPGRALVGRGEAGCNTCTAGVYSDSKDTRQSPAATRWVMAEDIGGCGRSAGVEDWRRGGFRVHIPRVDPTLIIHRFPTALAVK